MYPSLKLVPWILACPVWFCKTFAWNLTRRGKIYPFMVRAYWPGKIRRLILYMHCGQEFGHLLGKQLLNWNWWCNCCFRFHFFDDRQFVVYKTARIHAHFRNEINLKSRIHVFDLHISSCFCWNVFFNFGSIQHYAIEPLLKTYKKIMLYGVYSF